jgi:hypothetical protein
MKMKYTRPLIWYRGQPPGERYTHIIKHGDIWYYTWAPWWGHFEVTDAFVLGCTHDDSPPGILAIRTIDDRSGSGDNPFAFYPLRCLHWPKERKEVASDR